MSFGVYVHIPFCAHRCDYCAFATWTDRAHLMEAYAGACVAELEAARLPEATSVYFGGGTPSLLPPARLLSILDAARRADGCEVTVECNPETVTPALLAHYRDGGVNRISLGVQSTHPHVLASLGRRDAEVAPAVAWVAEAFDNWSVDLIYGAAGENDDDWDATLAAVLAWGPPHVSAYGLTVEAGTPLASDPSRHPDEDASARRYLAANAALERAGLANYEISNWARRGFECQHNLLYWQQGEYRGIGAAAHSHVDGRRWWNVRTPERYIEAMHAGGPAGRLVAGEETLDADGRAIEALELSLRTAAGVPADALSDVEMLTTLGLIEGRADRVVLTVTGRLLANEVAIRLRV